MIYFVDSNAAPGTVGTPFPNAPMWNSTGDLDATLTYVINNPSRGGDEIWALQGTYNLAGSPLVINQNREPLSIYGGFAGWERTLCDRDANIISNDPDFPDFFQNPSILDGGGTHRVIEMRGANVCRIDGFIITQGVAPATMPVGGGMYISPSRNVWLENLVIMDNTAGNFGGGIYTAGMWCLMIKNTIFFNNRATNGGGIWIGDGGNKLLVNLLFNANQSTGTAGNGNAIYIDGDLGMKIINNTISGNTGGAGSSSVYCMPSPGGQGVDINNSILYPDTLAVATGITNVRVDYCLLSNPIPFQNPNGLFFPPFTPNFVNPAGRNFHLQPTSPCIDKGNTNLIFPYVATDLEGKPRFIDNGLSTSVFPLEVDMGAFEVQ